jgi:hypothetical protein
MEIGKLLQELAEGWFVTLISDDGEWTLMLTNRRNASQHTYVSTNLQRLISHAWAGAPGGRV